MKSVSEYADEVMVMVHEDMSNDTMPRDVGSFSNMHDHTDANCYLIDVLAADFPPMERYGDEYADGSKLSAEDQASADAELELSNKISDEVDRRLAREALALDTGERCPCGRLVRFNGGAGGHWIHLDDRTHQCEPCQFCR